MVCKEDCYYCFLLLYLFVLGYGEGLASSHFSICLFVVGFPVERVVFPIALQFYLLTKLSFSVKYQIFIKHLLCTRHSRAVVVSKTESLPTKEFTFSMGFSGTVEYQCA